MSIYAVGDIHGQLGMLETALARIEADGGCDAKIVFLGDYVDRGANSRAVIELLSQGVRAGRNWVALKGNHDRMFEWFMLPEPRHDPHMLVGYHWFHERLGGLETMDSYGVDARSERRLQDVQKDALEAVPAHHVEFLRGLSLTHEEDGKLFVHAGIRPGVALRNQTEEDLVWIRQDFHRFIEPHPWLIVHGHTPVKAATHYGNRVNLDTGAGYDKPLSVAVFEGDQSFLLTDSGRAPLARA